MEATGCGFGRLNVDQAHIYTQFSAIGRPLDGTCMDKRRAEIIPKSQCHHLSGFQLGGLEGKMLTVVLQILSSQCHNLAVFLYSEGWLLAFAVVIMLLVLVAVVVVLAVTVV